MSVNALHWDNFVNVQSKEIATSSIDEHDNCSFISTAERHTFPVKEKGTSFIGIFDFENEVEVEIDVLPTIACISSYLNVNYFKTLFLNVFTTYSYTVLKVEFLDIFSPPPNC